MQHHVLCPDVFLLIKYTITGVDLSKILGAANIWGGGNVALTHESIGISQLLVACAWAEPQGLCL